MKKSENLDITIIGIKSSEIISAYLKSNISNISVKFNSEQVQVLKDLKGKIIYNNKNSEILRFTQEELTKNNRALINEIQNISLFEKSKIR